MRDFSSKNKSSRLDLEGTEPDVVFCAGSESAIRSVEIVVHLKEITPKSLEIGKNHPF